MNDIQRTIEYFRKKINNAISKNQLKHYKTAISAMEELQEYRQIGTVEECRGAMKKQRPALPVRGEIYSQACPKCGYPIRWHFCANCGQAIRYGHIEEADHVREDPTET